METEEERRRVLRAPAFFTEADAERLTEAERRAPPRFMEAERFTEAERRGIFI